MRNEKDYIVLYRTLVEQKYLLGAEGKPKQRDFEYLSQLIEETSKVKLSLSTLKRLWKEDVTQVPHPTTLDALVSILGFKNWHDFKQANSNQVVNHHPPSDQNATPKKKWLLPVAATLGVGLLMTTFLVIQGFRSEKSKLNVPKDLIFTTDKTVSYGVPNTVKFTFDLKGMKADTFFIQQSWNDRDRFQIDPSKKFYSVTYYSPGFHWARIMANDEIRKIQKVHIQTDGWLPIVKYDIRDNQNFYPDPARMKDRGVLRIPIEELERQHLDIRRDFVLRYYNVRDFEGVTSSNFEMEMRMKCDSIRNVGCPDMELGLIMEEGMFWIPMTSKGCVGNLALVVGERYKSGKDHDLSKLGVNVYDWQNLKVVNRNKNVSIYLNEELVDTVSYKTDFGKIKGMLLTFSGTGSVDHFRVSIPNGAEVYSEDFE
jgi:hypothetical protein